MKKTLLAAGVATLLMSTNVAADPLKDSLMNAGDKDTPMVSLDNIKTTKKTNVQTSRPKDAVVATVNGQNITKESADQFLAVVTKGQVIDFDKLKKQQRQQLIHQMSVPFLLSVKAQKELNNEEKNMALSRMWMQKKISSTKIDDKDAKKAYDDYIKRVKKEAAKTGKKDIKLPSFDDVKMQIKMKLAEEKVVKDLLNEAKITLK